MFLVVLVLVISLTIILITKFVTVAIVGDELLVNLTSGILEERKIDYCKLVTSSTNHIITEPIPSSIQVETLRPLNMNLNNAERRGLALYKAKEIIQDVNIERTKYGFWIRSGNNFYYSKYLVLLESPPLLDINDQTSTRGWCKVGLNIRIDNLSNQGIMGSRYLFDDEMILEVIRDDMLSLSLFKIKEAYLDNGLISYSIDSKLRELSLELFDLEPRLLEYYFPKEWNFGNLIVLGYQNFANSDDPLRDLLLYCNDYFNRDVFKRN